MIILHMIRQSGTLFEGREVNRWWAGRREQQEKGTNENKA